MNNEVPTMKPNDQELRRVSIKILEENYILRTKSSEEYADMLARNLDSRMKNLARENPKLSPYWIAVLTSLNLMDELEKSTRRVSELLELADRN